jgi:hypothetical protein
MTDTFYSQVSGSEMRQCVSVCVHVMCYVLLGIGLLPGTRDLGPE